MKQDTYLDVEHILENRRNAQKSGQIEKYDALSSQIDALDIELIETRQGIRWKLSLDS